MTAAQLVNAGKRAGISDSGLEVNSMDQSKFEATEAILNPPDVIKTPEILKELNSTVIECPERGVPSTIAKKLEQSLEHIQYLRDDTRDED